MMPLHQVDVRPRCKRVGGEGWGHVRQGGDDDAAGSSSVAPAPQIVRGEGGGVHVCHFAYFTAAGQAQAPPW